MFSLELCPDHRHIQAMLASNSPNYQPCLSNPARLAETEEERNDVITRWIKLQVGSHPDLVKFLQSQTKLQTMHEVLNQYKIVSRMLGLLLGLMTPVDYDRAPSCMVTMVSPILDLHLYIRPLAFPRTMY